MSSDFKDLLEDFNGFQVEYLLVGGLAVIEYTEPRYTKDMDLWIKASEENSKRVFNALAKFGAPLQGLTSQDFAQEGFFFQVGLPPARIDILMSLPGLSFDDSSSKKGTTLLWGVTVPILSIEDLIANKSAVGRDQDLADVKSLQRALKNKLTRAI